MKKTYFIKTGDFANVYDLYFTTTADQAREAEAAGCEGIPRRVALQKCIEERNRRRDDANFSGYADSHIWPWTRRNDEFFASQHAYDNGYIIEE